MDSELPVFCCCAKTISIYDVIYGRDSDTVHNWCFMWRCFQLSIYLRLTFIQDYSVSGTIMTTLKCLPSMKQNVSLSAKHYLKLSLTTVFVRIMNLRMEYLFIPYTSCLCLCYVLNCRLIKRPPPAPTMWFPLSSEQPFWSLQVNINILYWIMTALGFVVRFWRIDLPNCVV